jgi:hypothetical protein
VRKILQLCGIGLVLAVGQVLPAFADDMDYYVELGKDTTKEQAAAEWKKLVSKHKSLLSKLQFYPKAVLQGGVAVSTRIQAGPIDSKSKAQKICSKLFTDDIPCFVIEGIRDGETPPTQLMHLADKTEEKPVNPRLPWLAGPEDVNPPPAVNGAVALPWLAQAHTERKGQVQVAEAIRVPLSQGSTGREQISIKALPDIRPTFRQESPDGTADIADNAGAGWLTVDTFPNEDIATAFWGEVRSTAPKRTKNLRVRVMRPLMADAHKASLSIGPFASGKEADAFCETIQARERGLNCSYQDNSGKQTARSNAYGERRKHFAENGYGNLAPAAGPSKQYWVQVLSAASHMDALRQWDVMRSSNPDVFSGMRSSVSTSMADRSYVVRVGPIAGNDEAIQFCAKLQKRSINCQVLLYSVGL